MRLCEFTDPSRWDVVKTDGRGRPTGLSRIVGSHAISLYHDVALQLPYELVALLLGFLERLALDGVVGGHELSGLRVPCG